MANSEQVSDSLVFLGVVMSLGFVTGEMVGNNLSFKWIIISILALWLCVYMLGFLISGNVLAGCNTLAVVWTSIGIGAILGSMVRSSEYGMWIVPLTLIVTIYAANRYPMFALLLAIMVAGSLFTRFGHANAAFVSELDGRCAVNSTGNQNGNEMMKEQSTLEKWTSWGFAVLGAGIVMDMVVSLSFVAVRGGTALYRGIKAKNQ